MFDVCRQYGLEIEEVSEIAYDKAVEVVTEKVRAQTQEEDIRLLDQLCNNIVQNPNNSDKAKTITKNVIKMAKEKLRNRSRRRQGRVFLKNWLPIKSGSQKKMQPERKQKRNIMTGIPCKEHFDLFSFG